MSLYLVRHAKAGSRSTWEGDDRERPLSAKGWKQAEALADALAARAPSALLSSPYLRCVQTLEPLAERCDLAVVRDDRLAEGGAFEPVLDLLVEVPDGAVLCSHGDLVPDTMAALERRGCRFLTAPDWRKATVWCLERTATGEVVSAEVWPPPS